VEEQMSIDRVDLLRQLYINNESDLLSDFRKAEAALRDIFPDQPLKANTLLAALKAGVLKELTHAENVLPIEIVIQKLAQSIENQYSIRKEDSFKAVGTWAVVCGKIDEELLNTILKKYVEAESIPFMSKTSVTDMSSTGREMTECPHCGEMILKKAKICKHCKKNVVILQPQETLDSSEKEIKQPISGYESSPESPLSAPPSEGVDESSLKEYFNDHVEEEDDKSTESSKMQIDEEEKSEKKPFPFTVVFLATLVVALAFVLVVVFLKEEKSNLIINSRTEGVFVALSHLDNRIGKQECYTPCEFLELPAGEYDIYFQKEWYESARMTVSINPGETVRKEVELKPVRESSVFVNSNVEGASAALYHKGSKESECITPCSFKNLGVIWYEKSGGKVNRA
jgi:hypothetical protein